MEENENTTPEAPAPEAVTPEPTNGAAEPAPEAPAPEVVTNDPAANDPVYPPTPEEPKGAEAAPGEIPEASPATKDLIINEAERLVETIKDFTSFELLKAKEVIQNLLAVIKQG